VTAWLLARTRCGMVLHGAQRVPICVASLRGLLAEASFHDQAGLEAMVACFRYGFPSWRVSCSLTSEGLHRSVVLVSVKTQFVGSEPLACPFRVQARVSIK